MSSVKNSVYTNHSVYTNQKHPLITDAIALTVIAFLIYFAVGTNESHSQTGAVVGISEITHISGTTTITSCGNLSANGETYNLGANITTNGTCFNILANNIILDGGGFVIKGNSAGYGVNISSFNNAVIRNFLGLNNFSVGIAGVGIRNSTIFNNSIIASSNTNSYGIYFDSNSTGAVSANNTIAYNKLNTSGNNAHSIYLRSVATSNISGNTINSSAYTGYGINLQNTAIANTIKGNTIKTISGAEYGVYIFNSDNNTISENNIFTSGAGAGGIFNQGSHNTTIASNNITTTGSSYGSDNTYGIFLYLSTRAVVTGNSINTTNSVALIAAQTATVGGGIQQTFDYYNHTIDSTNTEQGKPIYYYFGNSSFTIGNTGNIGEIFIANSSNITIMNATFDKDGIILAASINNSIINNTFAINNRETKAIYIHSISIGNNISYNNITTAGQDNYGAYIDNSINTFVGNNNITVYGNGYALPIYTFGANSSTISSNKILATQRGAVTLELSGLNTLQNNNIRTIGNTGNGVYISSGALNAVVNNSIFSSAVSGDGILIISENTSVLQNNITTSISANGIEISGIALNTILNRNNVFAVGQGTSGIIISSDTNSNIISQNIIYTNNTENFGIYLISSRNINITGNNINATKAWAVYYPGSTSEFNNTIDNTNTQQGLPIQYYWGNDSIAIQNSNNLGELILASTNNITVKNLTLNKNGILLYGVSNTSIFNSTINTTNGGSGGIYSYGSNLLNSKTIVQGNNITTSGTSSSRGIYFLSAGNATVSGNNVATKGGEVGIYFDASTNNTISGNIINASGTGIYIDGGGAATNNFNNASYNSVTTITNSGNGIVVYGSATENLHNTITWNNITNGTVGIYLTSSQYYETVTNNRIKNALAGIEIEGVFNSSITQNIANATSNGGIWVSNGAMNRFNNISNNKLETPGIADGVAGRDLSFDSASTNNLFKNITLSDGTNISINSYSIFSGLSLYLDSNDNYGSTVSGKKNISRFIIFAQSGSGINFIDINISYTNNDVSAVNESSLILYAYNATDSSWSAINTSVLNTTNKIIRSGNITITNEITMIAPFGIANTTSSNSSDGGSSSSSSSGSSGSGTVGTSSGSGGTATVSSVITQSRTAVNVIANSLATLAFTSKDIPVNILQVTLSSDKPSITVTASKLDRLPSYASSSQTNSLVPSISYSYFEINKSGFINDDIKTALLTFTVNKSWLSQNSIAKEEVILYRYTTQWDALQTNIKSTNENTIIYEATLPGLSLFTIGIKKQEIIASEKKEIQQPLNIPSNSSSAAIVTKNGSAYKWKIISVILFLIVLTAMLFIWKKSKINTPKPEIEIYNTTAKLLRKHIRNGSSEQELKSALKFKGWSQEQIEQVFKIAKQTK